MAMKRNEKFIKLHVVLMKILLSQCGVILLVSKGWRWPYCLWCFGYQKLFERDFEFFLDRRKNGGGSGFFSLETRKTIEIFNRCGSFDTKTPSKSMLLIKKDIVISITIYGIQQFKIPFHKLSSSLDDFPELLKKILKLILISFTPKNRFISICMHRNVIKSQLNCTYIKENNGKILNSWKMSSSILHFTPIQGREKAFLI